MRTVDVGAAPVGPVVVGVVQRPRRVHGQGVVVTVLVAVAAHVATVCVMSHSGLVTDGCRLSCVADAVIGGPWGVDGLAHVSRCGVGRKGVWILVVHGLGRPRALEEAQEALLLAVA